jgi:hypothetical protein
MAKMRFEAKDRPYVKLECLRLLATLRLTPAKTRLISGFVDSYLRLNQQEQAVVHEAICQVEPEARGSLMEIVTSWKEEGLQQGLQQEAAVLVSRILNRKLGGLPKSTETRLRSMSKEQLEELGVALLEFNTLKDLNSWLKARS